MSRKLPISLSEPSGSKLTSSSPGLENIASSSRKLIGPADEYLYEELHRMYWAGVKNELAHVLLTLKNWQQSKFDSVSLPDELDDFIHGYDTFIDQVGHSTRAIKTKPEEKRKKKDSNKPPTYDQALRDRAWNLHASEFNAGLKEEIRIALDERKEYSGLEKRARILLQSIGLLDMDKVIEYRPPEDKISFWKRPATPQLKFVRYDENKMPVFAPQECEACQQVIRGCVFSGKVSGSLRILCESCYRKYHYGQTAFSKEYKHSILHESITPAVSRALCHCTTVQRNDSNGASRALFPIGENDDHRTPSAQGSLHCALIDVGLVAAEAKYQAMLDKDNAHDTLNELQWKEENRRRRSEKFWKGMDRVFWEEGIEPSLQDSENTVAEFGRSNIRELEESDIPLFLRSVTDKYPYGNVHMALRIGPLLIENGVAQTSGGALITYRDPPNLQILRDAPSNISHSLILIGDEKETRNLWSQNRTRERKRYKSMMKQVVGGAFSGLFNEPVEEDIIQTLVLESKKIIDPGLDVTTQTELLDYSLGRLMSKLKLYIGPRVEIYLRSITNKLIDPAVTLRWDFQNNNCQNFCDNILDKSMFGSLVAIPPEKIEGGPPVLHPLYLMSFVCRTGSYEKKSVMSKWDVPNGLTEEYLLKFRYGRHDDSDIIDTLQEYWYDWGAFGDTIYPYQDVFPWDCTEAYNRYPTKCGDCNIAKHVWAFPFDSWSIVALHLAKDRHLYPPTDPKKSNTMSDVEWMKNRLTILLAQDVLLTAAVAMVQSAQFQQSVRWLWEQPDAKLDRLKLGGIHRAQPFSHHFEKGAYHHYFIARWAYLEYDLQVAAYEKMRDSRSKKSDIGDKNDSGCGGCGAMILCGMGVGACAAGCSAGCGGDCGTGCAISCSSCGGCGGCGG